jgi:hypothetical protein
MEHGAIVKHKLFMLIGVGVEVNATFLFFLYLPIPTITVKKYENVILLPRVF